MSNVLKFASATQQRATLPSVAFASLLALATSANAAPYQPEMDVFGIDTSPLSMFETGGMFFEKGADPLIGGMSNKILTETAFSMDDFLGDNEFTTMLREASARRDAIERSRKAEIAEHVQMTKPQSTEGLSYVTFDTGIDTDINPLRFTHISGPVGVTEQVLDNGEKITSVTAHIGIDTDAYGDLKQVRPDIVPNSGREVGDIVKQGDYDISENARVAAMFTPDMGGITELQISVGADMRPDEEITLSRYDAQGNIIDTIDASKFQVEKVKDFLVLLVKDDPETLSKIYDTMIADGGFEVDSISIRGAALPPKFSFGKGFKEHLQQGYAELKGPSYHFNSVSSDIQRRLSYNINAPALSDDKVAKCEYLGLEAMTDVSLEDIRLVSAKVEDGTGTLPRSFYAVVALGPDGNVLAAGEPAYVGMNFETGVSTTSQSSYTNFVTVDGTVVGGCTGEITHTVTPPAVDVPGIIVPNSPLVWAPGFSWAGAPGLTWVGVPGTINIPVDETPMAPVPIPPALPMLVAGVASLRYAGRARTTNSKNELVIANNNNKPPHVSALDAHMARDFG